MLHMSANYANILLCFTSRMNQNATFVMKKKEIWKSIAFDDSYWFLTYSLLVLLLNLKN